MTEMTLDEARNSLSETLDAARMNHEPVYLLRGGRRIAALIDAGDLATLIAAAEELADLRAANAARAEMTETGEAPVPWAEAKAQLGLA
jgi:PHD/YefM family antitoxin component YafN of YafNO toxin-antitoxin module